MDLVSTVNRRIWRTYLVVGLVSLLPKAVLIGRELPMLVVNLTVPACRGHS